MPSEDSSPTDRCRCGHRRSAHAAEGGCFACDDAGMGILSCHVFMLPADAETAGCPTACDEAHTYSGSCALRAYGPKGETAGEPEMPPCDGCGHSPHRDDPCGAPECACAHPVPMPRRPPYAAQYVLEDGTPFEIALPGDATVRSEDGVLIVMHSQSPVKGLVQVKPWGDQ